MLSLIMQKKLAKHFRFQDFNKDGYVERADWEQCARNLAWIQGWTPDSSGYKDILSKHVGIWENNWLPADSDGDGKVSLNEYLELTDRIRSGIHPPVDDETIGNPVSKEKPNYLDSLLDLFGAIFDIIDGDNDGKIRLEDYKMYFKAWGVDEELADGAFASIDLNGDGVISRMSFVQFGSNFFISDDENEFGSLLFGPLDEEKKMDTFSIQHEQNGNAIVAIISGRVDSATAGIMDAELDKLINSNKRVVLDFKNVEFLSSAGVRGIVKAMKTAKRSRHTVKLAAVPDHIADMMKTLGMMEIMQVYPSVAEAIISF